MKWYSVMWKCILQTLGQPLKKFKRCRIDMHKGGEMESYKCSCRTTKGRKRAEDKNRNKRQEQQKEESNKYSRYYSNYINNHFAYQWPKHTNWKTDKVNPAICFTQEIYFQYKDTHRLRVTGWRKTYNALIRTKQK